MRVPRSALRPVFLALALAVTLAGCALVAPRPAPDPVRLRIADLLLIGFSGTQVAGNEEVRRLVCDVKVGGLLLFERYTSGQPRNLVSQAQVATLTRDLQALAKQCAGRPLFIAADAEGGRVMRLSPRLGYPPTLPARELGQRDDPAFTRAEARRMGAMLREAGINWNLAPVVDVAVNPDNPAVVALGRTYSSDPLKVAAHAEAFVRGMHDEGVLTALKHFPGHGSSRSDSHHGFTDVTDTARLSVELRPYRILIADGLADSVMTAHVFNRGLDPWDPATLSRYTVHRVLRGWLRYQGVTVSDDLLMGAIAQHYGLEAAAVLALHAGVDVLLISQNMGRVDDRAAERVVAAITRAIAAGRLSESAILRAVARVDALRARLRQGGQVLHSDIFPSDAVSTVTTKMSECKT
ncbi:MAG TPA: glycoside hydrolase family 3 N-terminal domain-containing protein [Methylomirabilota bacterium]|nr:glycoside hydrolase family 3 N-terminal domain-containing protein [Methylomirabilota bacterium]